MAVGVASAVAGNDGTVSHANGTSFASPTLCGLVACFWQACPWLTAKQVVEAVRNAGDLKSIRIIFTVMVCLISGKLVK